MGYDDLYLAGGTGRAAVARRMRHDARGDDIVARTRDGVERLDTIPRELVQL